MTKGLQDSEADGLACFLSAGQRPQEVLTDSSFIAYFCFGFPCSFFSFLSLMPLFSETGFHYIA